MKRGYTSISPFRVSLVSTLLMLLCPILGIADDLTMMIEEKLAALGYDTGKVDGEADVMTVVAISQFQAEKGLDVTGKASPQLAGILLAEWDKSAASSTSTSEVGQLDTIRDHGRVSPALVQKQEPPRRGGRRTAQNRNTQTQNNTERSPATQTTAAQATEACNFVLRDFDYSDWRERYLDYYDKWWNTSVTEADVNAYQDEEARKMGSIYQRRPWRSDIWKVRRIKYEATYGSDLTDEEKSALLATGWPNTNNPLQYFQKLSEHFGKLKCDGIPGAGSPPGLYFAAFRAMAYECRKNLSASEPIPCTNMYLGSVARRMGNYDVAFAEFEALADEGSPEAMFLLAQMYESGEGRTADKSAAIEWYKSAGEAGHRDASLMIGDMYFNGQGVPVDKSESAKWYARAQAFKKVGDMYFHGQGVAVNKTEGIAWYSKAFGQNAADNAEMAYNIGMHLEDQANIPMATLCFAKASIHGSDKVEFVEDARRRVLDWANKGAQLEALGISAYDEEARRFGFDPIDQKYSLAHVPADEKLQPCQISLNRAIRESMKIGAVALADFWNYGRLEDLRR